MSRILIKVTRRTVGIVDYGVGNIQAFLNMFKRLDLPAERAKAPADLADATRLILPGVGSFDHAMTLLNRSGLREPLEARVMGERVPVRLIEGNDRTALLLKVHTSNYAVQGYTAAVPEPELAALCRERGLPFAVDLGSGSLVDGRTEAALLSTCCRRSNASW